MRFTSVKINNYYEDPRMRYTEPATIETEEDLKNVAFFDWKYGDGFQWYTDSDYDVVVFYESHPFFNCDLLFYQWELDDPRCAEPLEVVDDFITKVMDDSTTSNTKLKQ